MSSSWRDPLIGRAAGEALPELPVRYGDQVFRFSLEFCGNREPATGAAPAGGTSHVYRCSERLGGARCSR